MENRKITPTRQYRYPISPFLIGIVFVLLSLPALAEEGWQLLIAAPAYSVTVNPQNLNTIYVGGTSRAVFRSFDAGQTWDTLFVGGFPGGANMWLSTIFIHPVDTTVLLVGGNLGTVRRSTNRGEDWEVVLENLRPIIFNGESIIVDSKNPNILYAGNFRPSTIYKSYNRGLIWDSISTIGKLEDLCTIVLHPDSSNIILAGCVSGTIFRSSDGGVTWKETQVNLPFTADTTLYLETPKIVYSQTNSQVAYTVFTAEFPPSLSNAGVYKTVDGGATWNRIAYADTSLWAIATRAKEGQDEIVTGGFSADGQMTGQGLIFHSPNGGNSWESYGQSTPWFHDTLNLWHKNVWMLKYFGPPDNQKLYMASERGFFVRSLTTSVPLPSVSASPFFSATLSSDRMLTIRMKEEQYSCSIRLLDLLGNTLLYQSVNQPALQQYALPSSLPEGMYACQLIQKGKVLETKLLPYVK